MPLSRYAMRNEYSLCEAEVYGAASKDDSEDLLEGVAMAGLVGVLRQLGDLAEFAADIFHSLHEEVMATTARGHELIIRVEQLETEIPYIEKAFLSQTDHSSFFYHAGVDWHPTVGIHQNLVSQEDLPRFIMDPYEECRAPPRLFLLDKFDVAGVGACLKRYTDPSFFKMETSVMSKAEIQKGRKIRKAKKKGPQLRNGENSQVSRTSHAKLHQLLLEERVENGYSNFSHRAKLKRRLNGFPFDSKTGKSYMEKLLESPSPDCEVLHEVTVNSSSSVLATNDYHKFEHEVIKSRSVEPDRENVGRKRSTFPYREQSMLNPSLHKLNEVPRDNKSCKSRNSYHEIDELNGAKVISVDAQNSRGSSLTAYQSDDIASKTDNCVDAPSILESEIGRDLMMKSDFSSLYIKHQPLVSDANEKHFQCKSSDSPFTGETVISDEGNKSSRKEMSSCPSTDSPSTLSENSQSLRISFEGFLSAHNPAVEPVDSSSYQEPAGVFFPRSVLSEDCKSQSRDDTPRSSAGEHLVDEPDAESIPCLSTLPDILYRSTERLVSISAGLMHENLSDKEDGDQEETMLNMSNVISEENTGSPEMVSTDNSIHEKLRNEALEFPEKIVSDSPDVSSNGGEIESNVSRGEETSLANNQTGDDEDDQNSPEDVILSDLANSSDWPQAGLDARMVALNPEEEATSNNSPGLGTRKSCEFIRLLDAEVIDHVSSNNSEARESPRCTSHILEEPSETSDIVEKDEITMCTGKFSGSADLKLVEVHLLLRESDLETDKLKAEDIAFGVPAVTENARRDTVALPVSPNEGVEDEDSCLDEIGNDKKCPGDSYRKSGLMEETGQIEGSVAVCNNISNIDAKSRVTDTVFDSHLDLATDESFKSTTVESLLETKDESFQQSYLRDQVADAPSTDENILQSILQEQINLPHNQLNQKLLNSDERLPISHQQMLDYDNHKGEDCSASLMSSPDPPLVSENQLLSKDNISGYQKDQLGSSALPDNTFSATNQTNLSDLPPLPPLPPAQWRMGELEYPSYTTTEEEIIKHEELFSQQIIPPTVSTTEVNSTLEEMNLVIQIAPETASKVEKVENSCSSLEASTIHESIDVKTKTENKQHPFAKTSEGEFISPAKENEHGSRTAKLCRPRNPLVDDVVALDKSKLRKVTERVRPEMPKVKEIDSFLEQIRNKSLNLKPAVAPRSIVRGPDTNRNVAAILEKADAMRQALASNNEDDEDNWSDS